MFVEYNADDVDAVNVPVVEFKVTYAVLKPLKVKLSAVRHKTLSYSSNKSGCLLSPANNVKVLNE